MKHVRLPCHQVRGLLENKQRLLLRQSALMEEVLPQKINIGSMSTSVWIQDIECLVGWYVRRRRRDLVHSSERKEDQFECTGEKTYIGSLAFL